MGHDAILNDLITNVHPNIHEVCSGHTISIAAILQPCTDADFSFQHRSALRKLNFGAGRQASKKQATKGKRLVLEMTHMNGTLSWQMLTV